MQRPLTNSLRLASAHRRGAFTMVELMMVIVIIGILLAILLPVLGNIQRNARVAQVVVDIKNLEKAIADFKLKYGVEPPSSIRLCEQAVEWDNTSPLARQSKAFIRQIWPDFNFSVNRDLNGDGDDEGSSITLNGAECLVFFLGGSGVLQPGRIADGFSVNPSNPFATGGNRVGPFYEFDPSRLTVLSGRVAPSLLDTLPGQTMPYQYFSSYGGRGYQIAGVNDTLNDGDDEVIRISGEVTMSSVYLTNDSKWNSDTWDDSSTPERPTGAAWNARSFQIISPGFDGEYGVGGTFSSEQGIAVKDDSSDTFRYRENRRAEMDNITNFSGGTLERMFTPPAP